MLVTMQSALQRISKGSLDRYLLDLEALYKEKPCVLGFVIEHLRVPSEEPLK